MAYNIEWDSEPGYDQTFVEWYDPVNWVWTPDPSAYGGAGSYSGTGWWTETLTNPYGSSRVRFRFVSDGAWSDKDGLYNSTQGAVLVDDLVRDGTLLEDFEGEACNAQQSNDGAWVATMPPGFGEYGELYLGRYLVQEDKCFKYLSHMWGWFDNPATTNYGCGGWPSQGAVPYGPDANGLYIHNEIWSPVVPIRTTGRGNDYVLEFKTYRDLRLGKLSDVPPFDPLVGYVWHVRTREGIVGCPGEWQDHGYVYFGAHKDWHTAKFELGPLVSSTDTHMEIALGVIDMAPIWGGIYGDNACHSHAPLIDQVRLVRVVRDTPDGPQWISRYIDMWQDNFPESGVAAPSETDPAYARCDMAQDIIPINNGNIVPGDSLVVAVDDSTGLADDNTGGRLGKAVYVFVRCTDRFRATRPYSGLQMQSPDNKAWATDPNAGLLRWPLVTGVTVTPPAGWEVYRMDFVYTPDGIQIKNRFCADLMDLAAGPDGPPYHPNEDWTNNTGIFVPGDVIRYFVGAQNTVGQWAYMSRTHDGQGRWFRTPWIEQAAASPMEWSVLPDAGRNVGDLGDILFVDDADDRVGETGDPPQSHFDWAFTYLGIHDCVDRFDVLGSSSSVGNSLASRVKNIQSQVIGDPVEIYHKVLWNCSDLSWGLMGDGGVGNGGSGPEKSDDFHLCYTFLDSHPNNPGWAYWGDDVVEDWERLQGAQAISVRGKYMNFATGTIGDQRMTTGQASPQVYCMNPSPPWLDPNRSFYVYGGCPVINDFDVPGGTDNGNTRVAHKYRNANGPNASLSQWAANAVGDTARFFLAGFGFDSIRDDDTTLDCTYHLREILWWFQNAIGDPIGIDPIAYENRLDNNYPNPFNPATTIKYSIAERGHVSLAIYNAAGQLVRTLVDDEQVPKEGGFSVSWDGTTNTGGPVASGVYFYRLTAVNFSQTKKMVVLK